MVVGAFILQKYSQTHQWWWMNELLYMKMLINSHKHNVKEKKQTHQKKYKLYLIFHINKCRHKYLPNYEPGSQERGCLFWWLGPQGGWLWEQGHRKPVIVYFLLSVWVIWVCLVSGNSYSWALVIYALFSFILYVNTKFKMQREESLPKGTHGSGESS